MFEAIIFNILMMCITGYGVYIMTKHSEMNDNLKWTVTVLGGVFYPATLLYMLYKSTKKGL